MDLRGLLEHHRRLIGGTAAGLVLVFFAAACYYRLRAAPPRTPVIWYYDLGDGALFTSRSAEPPIKAPSGADGVIAHVFACGDCARPADRIASYIETDTPELKKAQGQTIQAGLLVNPRRGDAAFMFAGAADGRLVSRPGTTPQWVSLNSSDGQAVLQDNMQCPDGQTPKRCPAE